jgi:phosphoenolpyruvate---glycerone phosphotransferase subunit DhaL
MTQMGDKITARDIEAALKRVSAAMNIAATDLNAADAALGDGDIGITVSRGLSEAASVTLPDDLGSAFMECAKAMQRVSASSYGTLLATAAMSAAKALKGRTEFARTEIPDLVEGAKLAMMARGKGALGDKTVLDALDAVAAATRNAQPEAIYPLACGAARATLEDYKGKPNKLGRARMFADASIGRYDPGQLALVWMLEAMGADPAG